MSNSANDNAQASGKKTIMPPDVLAALKDTEFENFLPRLEAELKSKCASDVLGARFSRRTGVAEDGSRLTRCARVQRYPM